MRDVFLHVSCMAFKAVVTTPPQTYVAAVYRMIIYVTGPIRKFVACDSVQVPSPLVLDGKNILVELISYPMTKS